MSTIPQDILTRLNTAKVDSGKDPNQLGQEDFLELMVAQVRNQDPFSPMENGEFIAQLAQFSMSDGIEAMQKSLGEMTESMTSSQLLSASALVGRSVLAPANSAQLETGGTLDGAVLLDEPASSITVNVFDSVGALVARMDVPAERDGSSPFSWNGMDRTGTPAPAGEYSLVATAMVDGENVAVQTALKRDISSITLGASSLGDVSLNLDNGEKVKLSSVSEVF